MSARGGGVCQTPTMDRMTDDCGNINLSATTVADGNNNNNENEYW